MAEDDAPSYIDEIHQDIAEFASRHLEEDERDDFVDSLLERKGYQRMSHWAAPEQQPGGGGGGKKPLVPRKTAAGGGGGKRGFYGSNR